MLISTYSRNLEKLIEAPERLNQTQIQLLTKIRSKGRFDRLMEVLPDGWEDKFKINFYDNPFDVAKVFCNEKRYKNSETIFEQTVLSIIINAQLSVDPETHESRLKYPATPAQYDEYYQRDYDYPVEAKKWKINQDMSYVTPASFHLDHKLIWTAKIREVDINSDINIEDVPYSYSINVYVPTAEILTEVLNLKMNGVL